MIVAGKKIPGYLIVIVAVLLAFALFTPLVLMPYLNKMPTMESEHLEAEAQIKSLEKTIANQDSIEKKIKELETNWEKYKKEMYVDADSTIDDLQKIFSKESIFVSSINRTEEKKDEKGIVSSTGAPLFSVQLNIAFSANPEKLLGLLRYFEDGSNGCYYIDSITCIPDEEGKNKDLETNMTATLYYFVENIEAATEPTTEPTTVAGDAA